MQCRLLGKYLALKRVLSPFREIDIIKVTNIAMSISVVIIVILILVDCSSSGNGCGNVTDKVNG